jgi:hypothetical protein
VAVEHDCELYILAWQVHGIPISTSDATVRLGIADLIIIAPECSNVRGRFEARHTRGHGRTA